MISNNIELYTQIDTQASYYHRDFIRLLLGAVIQIYKSRVGEPPERQRGRTVGVRSVGVTRRTWPTEPPKQNFQPHKETEQMVKVPERFCARSSDCKLWFFSLRFLWPPNNRYGGVSDSFFPPGTHFLLLGCILEP